MTYAQSVYSDPNSEFNWYEFLNSESPNWSYGVKLAQSWSSCACGNTDVEIPRYEDGSPLDRVLRRYGLDFLDAVQLHNPTNALYYLRLIEGRVKDLLANPASL